MTTALPSFKRATYRKHPPGNGAFIPARETIGYRLWSRVEKRGLDECWPWMGNKDSNGYGRFRFNGPTVLAHRVALSLRDPVPSPDMFACHACDNPSCCNPAHLWWGTAADNSRDACAKGRMSVGVRNGRAKLSEADVLAAYGRVQGGESCAAVARSYGVSHGAIHHIITGVSWKHINKEVVS